MNRQLEWGEAKEEVRSDNLGEFRTDCNISDTELDRRVLKNALAVLSTKAVLTDIERNALLALIQKYGEIQSLYVGEPVPKEILENMQLATIILTTYPYGISSDTRQRIKAGGHCE